MTITYPKAWLLTVSLWTWAVALAAAQPAGRPAHDLPGGRGRVGHGLHGQVRGERVAGAEPDDDQPGLVAKIQQGKATAARPDGGRRDAARRGERRLRAVRGQRAELHATTSTR